MNCYLALRLDDNGNTIWSPNEHEKWKQFRQTYKGKSIAIQAGLLSPLRSDEHMRYIRMKIGHVSKITGYRPYELIDLFFESCGLGVASEIPLRDTDSITAFFTKFRRISSKRITTAQCNELSERLDEFREFYNSGKPPELWLNWPERVQRAKAQFENV